MDVTTGRPNPGEEEDGRRLLAALGSGACLVDAASLELLAANADAASLLTGEPPAALEHRRLPDLLTSSDDGEADGERSLRVARAASSPGDALDVTARLGGRPLRLTFSRLAASEPGGRALCLVLVQERRSAPGSAIAPDETTALQIARERAAELDAVFAAISDPVTVYENAGAIIRANPAAVRLCGFDPLGLSREEVVRRINMHLVDGEDVHLEHLPSTRALTGETATSALLRVTDALGRERLLLATSAPLRVGQHIAGTVTVWRDVTTRERLVVELRAKTEALAESDRRKDEFLAVLSHELRNPLAAIRTSLYLLDRPSPGPEPARRARAVISRQAEHLTRLVDDLLDVTRITRGKIQLRRERLDLGQLVRRALDDNLASFTAARIETRLKLPQHPVRVNGDPSRLTQVVGNLLHNSAKFTPPDGFVQVSVEHVAGSEPAGCGEAVLRVRDNGVGIPPEMVPRLFEPFVQADNSLDRRQGGLGLGLALVKGLIGLHGGSVEGRSDGLGRGAKIVVRLPAVEPAVEEPATAERPQAIAARRRVLVVEDNADAAQSLRDLLEAEGHEVEAAHDGPEALAKIRGWTPDVVLCDIGLPGMDGYAVARALKAEPSLRDTVLVAVTGYAQPEDQALALAAGFRVHLAKPVSHEQLQSVLSGAPSTRPPE